MLYAVLFEVVVLLDIVISYFYCVVFFFKQKTAYEMRISDWSSDVCSSDLPPARRPLRGLAGSFLLAGAECATGQKFLRIGTARPSAARRRGRRRRRAGAGGCRRRSCLPRPARRSACRGADIRGLRG